VIIWASRKGWDAVKPVIWGVYHSSGLTHPIGGRGKIILYGGGAKKG